MAVRNPDRAKEQLSRVVDVCTFEDQIRIESLDISDLASIRQFAERMSSTISKIDILIHNGGWTMEIITQQLLDLSNDKYLFSWNNGVSI